MAMMRTGPQEASVLQCLANFWRPSGWFWCLAGQKSRIYEVFCPRYGIYSVIWTAPSRNTCIYAFIMLQEVFFSMPKSQNPCKWVHAGWGVLKWTATSWIIRQQGWPPSPLLRKVKLKVAPTGATFRDYIHSLHSIHSCHTLHCYRPYIHPLHRIHYIHCTYIAYSPYTTLHYIALHSIPLHSIPLHSIPLHSIPLHSITLHYIQLP